MNIHTKRYACLCLKVSPFLPFFLNKGRIEEMEENVDKKNGCLERRILNSRIYIHTTCCKAINCASVHRVGVVVQKMASLSRNPPQGFDKAIEACNNLPEDLLVDMVRVIDS